jgi:hypothetical protein
MIPMSVNINLYYQNCRGLRSKTNDFKLNVACNFYDIICISETWLMDSVFDGQLFDDRYIVFRRDRDLDFHQKLDGGGVLIAVLKIGSITSNGSRTWKRVLRIFS